MLSEELFSAILQILLTAGMISLVLALLHVKGKRYYRKVVSSLELFVCAGSFHLLSSFFFSYLVQYDFDVINNMRILTWAVLVSSFTRIVKGLC